MAEQDKNKEQEQVTPTTTPEVEEVLAELEKAGKGFPRSEQQDKNESDEDEGEGGDEEGGDEEGGDEDEDEEYEEEGDEEEEKSQAGLFEAEDLYRAFVEGSDDEIVEVVEASEALKSLVDATAATYERLGKSLSRLRTETDQRLSRIERQMAAVANGVLVIESQVSAFGKSAAAQQPAAGIIAPSPEAVRERMTQGHPSMPGGLTKSQVTRAIQSLIEQGRRESSLLASIDTRGPEAVFNMLTDEEKRMTGLV